MKCMYGDFTNTMQRDQLVLGDFDDSVRQRLLSESKLSFGKPVQKATIVEQITADVRELKIDRPRDLDLKRISSERRNDNRRQLVSSIHDSNALPTFPRCNYRHAHGKCKALNDLCFPCSSKGHFRRSDYCKIRNMNTIDDVMNPSLLHQREQESLNQLYHSYLDDVLLINSEPFRT